MENLDYWRLCDELTIVEAALLLAGHDPSDTAAYVEKWDVENRPSGYEAGKNAISRALENKQIEGSINEEPDYDFDGHVCGSVTGTVDVMTSRVSVESVRNWLTKRGFSGGFFSAASAPSPDYLDPADPRYAPKLAAAVSAWRGTQDPELTKGKSPKQALMKWLREHAVEFRLTDDEGNPNETGIEEAAKVANWQPTGGAPKTPSA